MIYLWDLRNNALIRSFAQVGDEVSIFPSSLQPGGCGCLRRSNRDVVEGCHRLATTEEREKLLKLRSPGRVSAPAAPLQYKPPCRAAVTRCTRAGSNRPANAGKSARNTTHPPHCLPAAEGWEPPRGDPAPVGHCPSSATDVGGGFPLQTAASPRVLGREASSRCRGATGQWPPRVVRSPQLAPRVA